MNKINRKEFCYKKHDEIVKIYKYLSSKNGMKDFKEKIKLLNDNKPTFLIVIKLYWKEANKLIEIIKHLSLNIINNRLANEKVIKYLKDLYKTLNKIDTPEKLHFFTYQIINEKNFYDKILQLYSILNDTNKCMKLLK